MAKIKNTRFETLQYTCEAPNQWTFLDAVSTKETNSGLPVPVGAKYTSEIELLSDAQRFAEERGYN